MRRRWLGLTLLLAAGLASGCKGLHAKKPYPADPLFASKEPIKTPTAPEKTLVLASAAAGPVAPNFPQTLLASEIDKALVPAQPVATARQPVAALPAVRSRPLLSNQVYGHSSDYGLLQGVLEKDFQGRTALRYCDPTIEDRWGGIVWLDPDPRVARFQDGDWVRVEGVLLSVLNPATDPAQRPRFRVAEINRQ